MNANKKGTPMTLDLDALAALDAIDRKGSFARAAEELGRVPSAITYLVRQLGDDLDVLLFDRRGHKAQLTVAGRTLLDEGRHLLFPAGELQRRVKQIESGWEAELRIAVDTILSLDPLFALLGEFYAEESGTRLRLSTEVLSGTWEALITGRADLAIGTFAGGPGALPGAAGYQSRPLAEVELVFAVAPSHPLADADEPLTPEVVRRHRVVAVGDSVRTQPAITVGILGGQDVLTVSSMEAKVAAQVAGLGCGNIPLGLAMPFIESGRLVPKQLTESRIAGLLHYSWSTRAKGKALQWFVKRLADPATRRSLVPG
jgi:DNA-binding transcriptional LysR family regulator